jgi:hypothetical protein
MDFFETFEEALTKASNSAFMKEAYLFSETVMFIVSFDSFGEKELLIKFLSPEMIYNERLLEMMKAYMDNHTNPFSVKFINMASDSAPPPGFIRQGNDLLYGYVLTKVRYYSTDHSCLLRSDRGMEVLLFHPGIFPKNARFVGYDPNVIIHDEKKLVSEMWEKDRVFVFDSGWNE